MHTARIGVFGASGYSGMELTRLLAVHPHAQVTFLASERFVGQSVADFTGVTGPVGALSYVGFEEAKAAAKHCDAVLLATPAEASLALTPGLLEQGVKVVDVSGAFRLQDAGVFEKAYGHAAPPAGLQGRAVYGLTELCREQVKGAQLVANPGCYPTAATLPLWPLLEAGLLEKDVIVSAASGASGAGRKATEAYSLVELHDDVKAYKVLSHQHTPEIAQSLRRAAGAAVDVTFTPHLLPVPRGILSTAYGRLTRAATAAELTQLLRTRYAGEPFIQVHDTPEKVSLHGVVGTNVCALGLACEPRAGGRVVVVSAIDNLVKGAAGQAVQNLNLALGLPETAGLQQLRRFH
jgi:N-acetyl-gamma-glutamyl-phosphate reductase